MPRKIVGPAAGDEVTYVPKALANATDPDPMRVVLRQPSRRERHEHGRWVRELHLGDALSGTFTEPVRHKFLREWVLRVENYVDEDGAPIATVDELIEFGEPDIVIDVVVFIVTKLLAPPITAPIETDTGAN